MQKVDQEVRKIIDEQYNVARKLIEDNRDKMEAMTQALLEWETIDADQINDIMEGRPPRPPKDLSDNGSSDKSDKTPPTTGVKVENEVPEVKASDDNSSDDKPADDKPATTPV